MPAGVGGAEPQGSPLSRSIERRGTGNGTGLPGPAAVGGAGEGPAGPAGPGNLAADHFEATQSGLGPARLGSPPGRGLRAEGETDQQGHDHHRGDTAGSSSGSPIPSD